MEQIATQEPMIQRAMTIEEAFMKNESERYLYELREKGRRDFDSAIITAEKRGKAEGKLEDALAMLEEGISLDLYHVASVDVKALERDERIFALVVLAARRMLDAGGDPEKRGLYSLELHKLMRERGYETRRMRRSTTQSP